MVDDRSMRFREGNRSTVYQRPPAVPVAPPRPMPPTQNVGAITQDTRSPLRGFLDQLNQSFRQSGVGNYLPTPGETLRGVGDFFLPFTVGQLEGGLTEPQLARQVKQDSPFPFAGDLALYAGGSAAGAGLAAGAKAVAPYVAQAGRAVGDAVGAVGDAASTFGARLKPAFQDPEVHMQALMRAIMSNPDTRISTVRSMNSMDDIIGGSGVFKSSRTTGTSGSQSGGQAGDDYNRWRETLENTLDPNSQDFVYGAVTSPVLRDIPAPFPLFQKGRENFLNYQKVAQNMDPFDAARSYGYGGGRTPMRYEWGPEAVERATLSWGDSLRGAAPQEGLDSLTNVGANVPNYFEAQIPRLTIDDISKITALGETPASAAAQGMSIADTVAAAGKDIPVTASSFNLPAVLDKGPFKKAGILDDLTTNPLYTDILSSLRNQRQDFLPSGASTNITNRGYGGGYKTEGAYKVPNWAAGHMLNMSGNNINNLPSSAVAQSLQNFYAQQISPRLQAFQRALFPEIKVPPTYIGQGPAL